MTKQINVGYNGSASSSEAVGWAAAEADLRGAHLRVISCYPSHLLHGSSIEQTQGSLRAIQMMIESSFPTLDVTTLASADPAASVLVDHMMADDLVVVGTSDHRVADRSWLGSTARHVVRHSPCPVVAVPGPGSWGRIERVVVGIDGSPTSTRALQWAGDEADRHGATLLVVHAWMVPYKYSNPDSSQVLDLTRVEAACLLAREVESAREQFGADVTGRLIECSPPAALLGVVQPGDLLVLGSTGHGAIHATLFGSTVSSVLDRCSVPCVVVRSS